MHIFKSTVGRKILMSVSGQLLILFVIVHLLGNSSIFLGAGVLNSYAEHLNGMLPLVWTLRVGMLVAVVVHVVYGVQITLENNAATPSRYAVKRELKANFASENMIWTGALLGIFILGHLLHFTFRVFPSEAQLTHTVGRYDVYTMVVTSFQHGLVVAVYVVAMVALWLHLKHGIASFLQTMGWNSEKTIPVFSKMSRCVSAVLMVGYVAIPVTILIGVLTLGGNK